jgi:Bacteriocin-protection, YdeI or OmpD-Associated/Domain of unknown function (DUF1905)
MRFRTTLQLEGKTATGFRVPGDVVQALGQGKRPPVQVTIGSHRYRSTIAAYGDLFMLPLSAENREAAGVRAGDEIDVDLELDTAAREVTVPADFVAALATEPEAKRFFAGLSYSQQRWFVLGIEGAKTTGTRQRRIQSAVARLREGRGQR